jgi:amino acid adenylation domain-containing protein
MLGVHENLSEAYARQDYPINRLIRDLKLEDAGNRFPLFDVALVLKNIHEDLPEIQNDITLIFEKLPNEITCKVEYREELFRKETVEQFVNHILNLLSTVLKDPDIPIRDLDLLSEVEREELVEQWSGKSGGWEERERVDELIAAQARQRPDAVAVVSDEEHVSYGALNRRANQLAHYLQRRGIGVESVVGVAVERSAEMVVALLGILKAGGAYLPLDVEQPARRLQEVWRDSGAQLLLSGQRVKAELSEKLGEEQVTVLCVEDEWEVVQRESAVEPESGAGGENLSYVIYTSGSTGQAKGVGLTHRGLSNLAVAQARKFGLEAESRVLQFAVLSFDASVSEIFTTLSSGGVLHLGGREAEHRRGQLMRVLREEQITVVTLPPALLAVTRAEELPALATLVVAGEACPWEVAERWSSGRRLLNAYGPTETTVCATMHEWAGESVAAPRHGTVSIGVPMENMEVYVLDEGQQLVGVGVSGELCIGGLGVGRGYLGQAALTAEKFIPHPFSAVAGARLYRSGDVVRYRGAGELEFLGRVDDQVKVRGHRVELGEVEAALRQERGVKEAAVVVRGEQAGEKQLVGYVVSDEEWEGEVELKARLRARLPEYMVPSVVVQLAEMPVNRRGKLDRQALPEPDGARPELQPEFIAPRTPVEHMLAEIWSQVLGIDKIGVKDNFFALGGQSILAAQVIGQVHAAINIELPAYDLFENPTIMDLARHIETLLWTAQDLQSPLTVMADGREEGNL